jgi:transposase
VAEMPVKPVAELVSEEDKKIWRGRARLRRSEVEAQDLVGMERLGIDDTSFRLGQSCVSVFADLDPSERRAVFVAEGRAQDTVEQFAGFLAGHVGEAEKIAEVCQDVSGAYFAAVRKHFKRAQVTFDRLHVKQKLGEAIDEVRRGESKQRRQLPKNTCYLWLKRRANLTARQQDWLDHLRQQPLQTARAYERALRFDDLTSSMPTRPRST